MKKETKENWTNHFKSRNMPYPAEYVIRIFKGQYPKLNLRSESFNKKKICDLGCGSGRHIAFLSECGFKTYGMEISEEFVKNIMDRLRDMHIETDIRVGTNISIPFENYFFDFLLSWNECYYMGDQQNFEDVVQEFARVLKKNAYLILSIPKKTNEIFRDCDLINSDYAIIRKDKAKFRIGTMFRIFEDDNAIEHAFSEYFKDFIFGSIHDDCFGYDFHWHLILCQKK